MSTHLDSILKLIEQSQHLSAAEKESVAHEVIQTEEELQGKNRDLQIEASLDRVRTVALSMKTSDDLLNVCEILFQELHSLGFSEMRNAMINILNDEKEFFLNYDYSDNSGKTVTRFAYNAHPIIDKQTRETRSAKDAFIEFSFSGKELDDFRKFRMSNGEPDDSRLNGVTALYYYFYSIGIGSVGISAFNLLNEQKRNVLKRFRNVFDLAYRRYMDVALAEAQAHEARIETSLERVRASAMAMHTTDELKSVGEIIYHELKSLGFSDLRNTEIIINIDEKETVLSHYCDYGVSGTIEVDYKTNSILKKWAEEMKSASDAFVPVVISEKEMKDWRKFREEIGYPPDLKLNAASTVYYYSYSTGLGALSVSSFTPISDKQLKILGRFRNVFALAYRRYADVSLAEAQALEAQIELALERVRARSVAMHHSTELHEVADVLFRQLLNFGGNILNAGIVLCKSDADEDEYWVSSDNGIRPVISIPHTEDPVQKKLYEGWKNKLEFYSESKGGDELKAHYNYLVSVPTLKPFFEEGVDSNRSFPTWQKWHAAYFSHGYLFLLTPDHYEEEKILVRFAKIFEQAYTRFLDLQKAEAQTREAQIEVALERVRSKAMAMHKSDDLNSAVAIVFEELDKLNLGVQRCGIGILDIEKRTADVFTTAKTDHGNVVQVSGDESMDVHPLLTKAFEAWQRREDFYYVLKGSDLVEYYRALTTTNFKLPDSIQSISDKEGAQQYYFNAMFQSGGLFAFRGTEFPEEARSVMKRFAGVFNLTYKRFLDLQKAEAQTREAQIQLALERVRARTMAMQKSEELSETAQVLFNQFNDLGAHPIQITIGIFDEDEGVIEFRNTDPGGTGSRVDYAVRGSIEEPTLLKKIYADWKEGKKSTVLALSGKELSEWVKYRISMSGVPDDRDYFDQRRVVYVGFFSKGMLSVSAIDDPDRESVQLLERFAGVFDLTYTRFLDLKRAEAQAREAKIETSLERVRSKAMAMHISSDLTEAAGALFTELNKLGINPIRSGFVLLTKESRKAKLYSATSLDKENTVSYTGEFEFIGHPVYEKQYESWQKKENYFPVLEGETLISYYKILSEALSVSFDHFLETDKQFGCFLPFSEGFLFTWSVEPYSKEEINILERFKSILDLTIRRYLDLQKAEAQAREAQIETSLERVRSSAMAMHQSGDLSVTVNIIFRELKNLGIVPVRCGVTLINGKEQSALVTLTTASHQGESYEAIGNLILRGSATKEENFRHWRLQQEFFPVLSGKELKEYYKAMEPQIVLPDLPADAVQYGSFLYFKEGGLFTWTERKISQEELQILRKFTSVISLTYRRYLDLKEAEAQAREAQVEAGLERVRSRTLAMHSSDELAETAAVLFKQVINLGIEPNRLYIAIIKDESGDTEFWITDEDGSKVSTGFSTNLTDNRTFRKMFAGWKEQKRSIVIDMEGEELQEYFRQLSELNVPFKGGLSQTRRVQNIAYFSQGFIGLASPESQPEETEKLLERFASVFNLTYTRFNDLQVAEAHAIQSQIEEQKLREEKKRSDALLLNILPEEIANELKQFGKSYARKHDEVTILFADIKGFSTIAENLSATELVNQLDECFRAFDHIVDKHGLEKIKTVGDAYVCACGLPKPVEDNAVKAVRAGLDMMNFIKGFAITKTIQDLPAFEFRIGINTGSVVTGVVGLKKFTYDIWGDAVNMAARMEQHGEAGKINISGSTYALVKDKFTCTPRGKILAKNKGEVEMYFVERPM